MNGTRVLVFDDMLLIWISCNFRVYKHEILYLTGSHMFKTLIIELDITELNLNSPGVSMAGVAIILASL